MLCTTAQELRHQRVCVAVHYQSGQPVMTHIDGRHEIESQERKIGEIVVSQGLPGQMGVEAPQPTKAPLGDANAFQVGKNDASCIADDDGVHRAPSIHQHSYLSIDFSGQLRQGAGELLGDDCVRRNAFLVDLFQAPEL